MSRRPALILVVLAGVACAGAGEGVPLPQGAVPMAGRAPAPAIWAGATGGSHGVGVARTAAAGIEVTYWYPATAGGRAARLGDFSSQSSAARAYVNAGIEARWQAPPEAGGFPLVLIGQGNQQDAIDQAVLAEIVASHGYVVASIPSPAIASPMKTSDDVVPMAQRQAEGLLSAAAQLGTLGVADVSRMAVIGHSFGARAALLLAMHDTRVRALVSLDGGIGTSTAQESFTQAPWFSRERGTAAILHFYETADSFMAPDFSLLQSLPALTLSLREVKGLRHIHFTSMGFQAAVDTSMRQATQMGPDGPASLVAMINELVRFLQAEVR